MLMAILICCAPLWLVQWLQVKTGKLSAPMELSFLPKTVFLATLAWMFLTLGNTGGGAFIYFQF
jgi:hypothetical protein